jgi:CBS-domain-containing membrane protein
VLVIEEGELGGWPRRVESFSLKSRNLSGLKGSALDVQMIADAREALRKYGETLDVRRDSLQPLLREGREVPVQRVRLVYEGGTLLPKQMDELDAAVNAVKDEVPGVEVIFQ